MRVVVAGLADFYYYRRRIRVVNYSIQIAMATVSETSPEKKKKWLVPKFDNVQIEKLSAKQWAYHPKNKKWNKQKGRELD